MYMYSLLDTCTYDSFVCVGYNTVLLIGIYVHVLYIKSQIVKQALNSLYL